MVGAVGCAGLVPWEMVRKAFQSRCVPGDTDSWVSINCRAIEYNDLVSTELVYKTQDIDSRLERMGRYCPGWND